MPIYKSTDKCIIISEYLWSIDGDARHRKVNTTSLSTLFRLHFVEVTKRYSGVFDVYWFILEPFLQL
jgi:hypothetical protein